MSAQKHAPTKSHNYMRKLDALTDVTPGKIYIIDVKHDPWCDIHKRKSASAKVRYCNCDPDVSMDLLPDEDSCRKFAEEIVAENAKRGGK